MQKTQVLKNTSDIYHENIWVSPLALNYLINERGLTEQSIERFRLGFAKGNLVNKIAKSEKWLAEAISLGIVKYNSVDFFEGYITIPIFHNGLYENIYSRNLTNKQATPHKTLPNIPKNTVYNLVDSVNSVIIVESPLDAITLQQHGFNSCAVLGIKLSQPAINSFHNKICYILFDSDSSGKTGANNLAKKLAPVAKNVYIVKFPTSQVKMDANLYFRTNKNAKDRLIFLLKNSAPINFREFGGIRKKTKKNLIACAEDQVDIVVVGRELFDDYIEKGNGIWVNCPIHKGGNESNKSLLIGGKNMFYCFGCNVGGGPVKLVSWVKGISREEAKLWIQEFIL